MDWSVFIILNPNLSVSVISDIWLGWTGNKSLSNRSSAGSESESKYIVDVSYTSEGWMTVGFTLKLTPKVPNKTIVYRVT
ncbi:hypothetical protein QPK24_07785 [Paenibacillus polygoni]|uniref:Uncharacterized protein n=1 Tax=Paenibacillus polygoni TaxID=3050112 RepID=A0ABY8X8V1_9BACL|nr:hypothetical protein [Paenibacillus polygoni]WIV20573.1 hypothetical protein QPK24_07785 [Paenibacillus polygoni]